MKNDFSFSHLFEQGTVEEINKVTNAITNTEKSYASLTKALAGGIKIDVKSIDDLKNKQESIIKIEKDLISTQNELIKVRKDYENLLKDSAKQIQENVKAKLEEAKANKENATAELQLQKAKTETLRQERLINQQNKNRKASEEDVSKALNSQAQSITQATEQNKILRQAVKDVIGTDQQAYDQRMKLNSKINENTEFVKRNSDAYVKQKMTIGDYKEQMKIAWSELRNGEKGFSNIGIVAKNFGGILKTGVKSGLDQVSSGLGTMIKGFIGAQAIISGFQKLVGQIKVGINAVIDFEAANSKLAAILGTASKNIKDLISDAQRLGATTKYTASQVTDLQIELAKLGFSRQEILDSTEAILKFAQATGSELGEAASLAGASLRMFGADAKEAERYVSAMAIATTKSALNFSTLQTALPIAGSVAKQFGFEIEDVLALLGTLADAGVDASSAATATRNILLNLANDTGKLSKAMGGSIKTFGDFTKGLQKITDDGVQLAEMLDITDKRSVNAFANFAKNADKIEILRQSITGVEKDLGEMADTMQDNVVGAIYNLSSAWEAFFLSFSESTGPMKDFINFLSTGLRNIANELKNANQIQDDYNNTSVKMAQNEMQKSEYLEKNTQNMKKIYEEYIESGKSADEAAKLAKEEYINTLKSRLEYENTDYQIAIDNRKKLEGELKDRGFFTILTSWKRTNNVIKDEIDVASKAAAGRKAISSITDSLINQLEKIDLIGGESKVKPRELTDKEKKELERLAKERLRIQKELQNSELALMDEGLEKELAKIRLNYTQKIASIIGNSKEEQKTRENLALEMQNALDKYSVTYSIDKEKKDLQNKLAVVRQNSKEEMDLTIELLEYQMWQEMDAAEKTGESVLLIEDKYNKLKQNAREKYANEQNKKLREQYSKESLTAVSIMTEELGELEILYKKGAIGREEYEKRKLDIVTDYSIKEGQRAVDLVEEQLESANLSAEEREELEKKLFEAKMALYDAEVKARQDADNAIIESEKRKLNSLADGIKKTGEFLNAFTDLSSALFDRRIQSVEEEQEANQEAYDQDIERIERLEETGAITTEEAEARKRAAEEKTAQKEKELAKKKAELQTKQAKFEKANALAQSIINTAASIVKTGAQLGFPAAIPFIVTAATLGAIQQLAIIAQPIPKYAKGTKDHKGGAAIVGDGGKNELVITPSGKSWITPSFPTLVDIPKGSMVLPDLPSLDLEEIKKYVRSDAMIMMQYAEKQSMAPVVNVGIDTANLQRSIEKGFDKNHELLARSIKEQKRRAEYNVFRNRIDNRQKM